MNEFAECIEGTRRMADLIEKGVGSMSKDLALRQARGIAAVRTSSADVRSSLARVLAGCRPPAPWPNTSSGSTFWSAIG
jgi:hypothetical protein